MFIGDGEEVGTIDLVAWPAKHYTLQGTHIDPTQNPPLSNVKSSSSISVFPEITNRTADEMQDPRLTVRVMLTDSSVALFDVFLLVMTVLVDAARLGVTERVRDYESPVIGAGVEITFGESVPARTRPPFFEVQWLIKTMALIPGFMIRKGVFMAALVVVDVDGVSVAAGFLGEKQAGVGLTNAKSNVSVA